MSVAGNAASFQATLTAAFVSALGASVGSARLESVLLDLPVVFTLSVPGLDVASFAPGTPGELALLRSIAAALSVDGSRVDVELDGVRAARRRSAARRGLLQALLSPPPTPRPPPPIPPPPPSASVPMALLGFSDFQSSASAAAQLSSSLSANGTAPGALSAALGRALNTTAVVATDAPGSAATFEVAVFSSDPFLALQLSQRAQQALGDGSLVSQLGQQFGQPVKVAVAGVLGTSPPPPPPPSPRTLPVVVSPATADFSVVVGAVVGSVVGCCLLTVGAVRGPSRTLSPSLPLTPPKLQHACSDRSPAPAPVLSSSPLPSRPPQFFCLRRQRRLDLLPLSIPCLPGKRQAPAEAAQLSQPPPQLQPPLEPAASPAGARFLEEPGAGPLSEDPQSGRVLRGEALLQEAQARDDLARQQLGAPRRRGESLLREEAAAAATRGERLLGEAELASPGEAAGQVEGAGQDSVGSSAGATTPRAPAQGAEGPPSEAERGNAPPSTAGRGWTPARSPARPAGSGAAEEEGPSASPPPVPGAASAPPGPDPGLGPSAGTPASRGPAQESPGDGVVPGAGEAYSPGQERGADRELDRRTPVGGQWGGVGPQQLGAASVDLEAVVLEDGGGGAGVSTLPNPAETPPASFEAPAASAGARAGGRAPSAPEPAQSAAVAGGDPQQGDSAGTLAEAGAGGAARRPSRRKTRREAPAKDESSADAG